MTAAAEQRLDVFRSATSLLASSQSFDDTIAHTIAAFLPALGDFGFFDLRVDGEVRRTSSAHEDDRVAALLRPTRWVRQDRDDLNLCALSTGEPALHPACDDAWYRAVAASDAHLALLRDLAFGSMITVPMRFQAELLGALTLFHGRSARRHDAADLAFAADLAALAAPVVAHARARREAEAASRAKDQFIAMLGHELRNPLAPIKTALQLMEQREGAVTSRERDVIHRQVAHLTRLVDDLLDVARIERGQLTITRERLDARTVITRAVEASRAQVMDHELVVAIELGDEPVAIDGDRIRLCQVIGNLLVNAARFSPPGERIDLRATATATRVEIEVRDRGVGIAPELMPRIFELFVQGPQPLARETGGLGLGLAIVASLVTLHGGEISAESAGPGQGASFRVTLPRVTTPVELTPPAATTPAAGVVQILLVDDNQDAREMLGEFLTVAGFEVQLAGDGPAALDVLAGFTPQVAILDIGLPGMDGYELARELRRRLGSALHLIAVTGYGLATDRERSREAGFDEHLVKPVDATELVARLAARAQA